MIYLRRIRELREDDSMYFDPGTGSMIVQIVIATVAGVGAFFVTFKSSIVSFFKGISKKNDKKDK